jgi:multidrug efflux pump subunit AcrB
VFRFAVEKPVILTVAILIVTLFGVLAVFRTPVQMTPDLDVRAIRVETRWPGATPQDVEKEIILEQEEYLRRIPGIERMVSEAFTGQARIELEFPHASDVNELLIRVNNALAQVPSYPENVDEPRIVTQSYSTSPFIFLRISPLPGNPRQVNMMVMRDFIEDHVATRIERVAGVSEVNVWGGTERQVRIFVDPVKLAERQIRLIDVRNAIRARNQDVSGGDLNAGKRRYLLRTKGRFETIEDVEDLVIARQGDAFVRLRDVGYAEMGGSEIRSFSYGNGSPAITLGIRRQIGANVVTVKDNVMAAMGELNAGLLKANGLEMHLNTDDVQYVQDSIRMVSQNLAIGAVLAVAVLFLFLRSSSATLIGAMGIPICTVAAFLGLLLTGRTINVISLAGVAFAIGMTLDNSIVVLENTYRHLSTGMPRRQAAITGVREVWSAVLASTLTTVFVFLPIVFVEEEPGQLYSDIAIAISASILMSMVVSVTLVPAACSRFLKPVTRSPNLLHRWGRAAGRAVMGNLAWLMQGVGRRIAVIAIVLLTAAAIIEWLTPQAEYLPEGEEPKIFASLYAPPGYNIDEMHAIVRDLNDYLVPHVGADPAKFDRGETDVPAIKFVLGYAGTDRVRIITEVLDRSQVDDLMRVVSARVNEYPGMDAFVSRGSIFASSSGGARSIDLDISGLDIAPLFDASLEAAQRAEVIFDNPQIRREPSSLAMAQPFIEINPDWDRASELGIDPGDLGYTIWAYSDGAYVDEFFLKDDKIDMFLYSTQGMIENPEDINNIMLYSPQGGIIPLAAVASVSETVNTETIRRVDGRRTITLGIIPPREIPLEAGVERVNTEIIDWMKESGAAAADINMEISGASDRLEATREALSTNFLVAVLIAYLLMVAIFSHWGYPFLIMTSVPIGLGGGIVGLWLLNFVGGQLDVIGLGTFYQPFDMLTMLGFLILIGTVVNNPILIVERSITNMRDRGMPASDAVMEATRTRLRPIVMSSITTIFGLAPLVFNPGAGTELYRGLGAIVLFGLLFSSIITLTFMPTILSLILQWRERFVGGRKAAVQQGSAG